MPSPFQLNDLWLTALYLLTPTHSIIPYGNIFDLHPLSQEHNWGVKGGLCYIFIYVSFFVSSLISQSVG